MKQNEESIELNPDGTLPRRKVKMEYATCTTSTWYACPHTTGWWFEVKFLFWTKKLYWCDLCHKPFKAKWIKAIMKLQKEAR